VRVDAPLYVAGAVLDEAGAVVTETPDEQAIDDEVARFRAALDALDPAQLQLGPAGAPGAGPAEQDESGDPAAAPRDDEGPGDTGPGSGPQDPPDPPRS
jgi:hypothetical protein